MLCVCAMPRLQLWNKSKGQGSGIGENTNVVKDIDFQFHNIA